jgi:hypothetical protein
VGIGGFIGIGSIKRVSSENRGFFYRKDVLGGDFNIKKFGGIYQYLVKLEVFFNIPRTRCHVINLMNKNYVLKISNVFI